MAREVILDGVTGLYGVFLRKERALVPNCEKIIWRTSIVFGFKTMESIVPEGAFKKIIVNHDRAYPFGYWVITSDENGKAPFLEQLNIETSKVFAEMAKLKLEKDAAESAKKSTELKAQTELEKQSERIRKLMGKETEKPELFMRREFE